MPEQILRRVFLAIGHGTSVAATPTWSQPEVKVETQLAENLVVRPHTRSATHSAELAAATHNSKSTSYEKKCNLMKNIMYNVVCSLYNTQVSGRAAGYPTSYSSSSNLIPLTGIPHVR